MQEPEKSSGEEMLVSMYRLGDSDVTETCKMRSYGGPYKAKGEG